jgi:aminoglycoside phosphotransferase (APT) family kinase protein
VRADWRVPTARNASEVAWIETVGRIVPAAVPGLLAHDPAGGWFAMAWLDPVGWPVWKARLAAGAADPAFAARVGATLVRIHAATARDPALAGRFANDALFDALRLDPYLGAAAARHPGLAMRLDELRAVTAGTRLALVHGDVSPKNVLLGPDGPVFLDAECATFGDPTFDLAFVLNHLLLKCLWVPGARAGFLACYAALADAYLRGVDWEPVDGLDARASALLPALLLARVDGKSPVEYLADRPAAQDFVRGFAARHLRVAPPSLDRLRSAWAAALA